MDANVRCWQYWSFGILFGSPIPSTNMFVTIHSFSWKQRGALQPLGNFDDNAYYLSMNLIWSRTAAMIRLSIREETYFSTYAFLFYFWRSHLCLASPYLTRAVVYVFTKASANVEECFQPPSWEITTTKIDEHDLILFLMLRSLDFGSIYELWYTFA